MRETLEIFVMIVILLLFNVVGLPTPDLRHLNRETDEAVSRTETNLYQEEEVQTGKHCADPEYERNFIIEPDLRGDTY